MSDVVNAKLPALCNAQYMLAMGVIAAVLPVPRQQEDLSASDTLASTAAKLVLARC